MALHAYWSYLHFSPYLLQFLPRKRSSHAQKTALPLPLRILKEDLLYAVNFILSTPWLLLFQSAFLSIMSNACFPKLLELWTQQVSNMFSVACEYRRNGWEPSPMLYKCRNVVKLFLHWPISYMTIADDYKASNV